MTKYTPLIVAMFLALAMPAGADEITAQLDRARAEYDSGALRKAVQFPASMSRSTAIC